MAIHDDDDFRSSYEDSKRGGESWDIDEDPDDRDIPPDDRSTIPCSHCGKLIFDGSEKCPYCRHWQMETERPGEGGMHKKRLWWWATVIICSALMALGWLGAHFWIWGR